MNVIQAGKIYSEHHPKFQEFITTLYDQLQDVLKDRKELIIGIVDNDLAWEDEIFFDLNQKLKSLIAFLQESDIDRIIFQQGLRMDELTSFIAFLTRTKRMEQIDEEEYYSLHGIQNIRAGKLRKLARAAGEKVSREEETRTQYEHTLQFVSQSLGTVLNQEEIDLLDLRFNTLTIMENFMGRHQELLNLISVKEKDLVTYIHLINVSILSTFVASRLGFSKEEVLDIGIAALFHDIGKLYISRKIIKKKAQLADEEFSQMKDHPLLGAKILNSYKDNLGILPAVVAFEHHLRFDLKGYPRVTFPQIPHIASLIVSMCDVYDALALRRTYKKDYPPNKIYEVMVMEKGRLFDSHLLDRFFQIIGVWPVGTIVSLSDARIAVVREVNEGDIFNPKVEVVSPPEGREFINLAERKDEIKITEALNPFGVGKKYLNLIYAENEKPNREKNPNA